MPTKFIYHGVTWWAEAWPSRRLRYRPAVFFHDVRLTTLSLPKDKFGARLKTLQFPFCYFLKIAQVWNCVTSISVCCGGSVYLLAGTEEMPPKSFQLSQCPQISVSCGGSVYLLAGTEEMPPKSCQLSQCPQISVSCGGSVYLLAGTEEIPQESYQLSQCPHNDSNQVSPEYKSETSPLQPKWSVGNGWSLHQSLSEHLWFWRPLKERFKTVAWMLKQFRLILLPMLKTIKGTRPNSENRILWHHKTL
jgi:hypothetical protein